MKYFLLFQKKLDILDDKELQLTSKVFYLQSICHLVIYEESKSNDEIGLISLLTGFEAAYSAITKANDSQTLYKALSREDGEHWYKATCDKINFLLYNGTWKLVKLPEAIDCK
jgi:hypothetical protein